MTDPITTALITTAGKGALNVLNENQKGMINYFLIKFFSKEYKEYLKNNILIRKEAEFEAYQEFEGKIQNIETNIHPVLLAIQNESEVENKNMFGVLDKAIQKVKGNAQGNIDTDKIKRLKDLSKDFSSDEMQEVIAGILAGEYNQSGTFSLKTMDIVRSLSRDELNIFRKFCGLVINKDFIFGNFYSSGNKNLTKLYTKGIGYDNYLYLQELGLITGSNSSQELGDETGINYNYGFIISDNLLTLKLNKKISLNNKSILTKAGKEIYSLINPIFDEDLFNMSKEELIRQGFEEIK